METVSIPGVCDCEKVTVLVRRVTIEAVGTYPVKDHGDQKLLGEAILSHQHVTDQTDWHCGHCFSRLGDPTAIAVILRSILRLEQTAELEAMNDASEAAVAELKQIMKEEDAAQREENNATEPPDPPA